MTEFLICIYAMLAMFVIQAMRNNQRTERPNPQMMTLVGWGLFSLSSTLAILLGAVGLVLMLGHPMPLPAGFEAPLF